jgi:hypothetical protein
MDTLKALLDEAIGMFVDDGSLAIALLVIVAVAAWVSFQFEHASAMTGVILLVGSLVALAENVIRTVRKAAASSAR